VLRVKALVPRLIERDLTHELAEIQQPLLDALEALVRLVQALVLLVQALVEILPGATGAVRL
jgi:hypothetical protein